MNTGSIRITGGCVIILIHITGGMMLVAPTQVLILFAFNPATTKWLLQLSEEGPKKN